MRTTALRGALAGACLMLVAGSARADSEIKWAKSYQAALAEAKASNRLVMADFYTDWWGWCKRLDATTYKDPKFIQLTGQVVPVKINAEKEGVETAKKYKVSGFPTILFINSTGEVEGTIVGYKPADGFSQDLTKFASAHKDLPALEARYKSNPDDAETAERLASIYAGRGKAERAEEVLAKAEKADPDNAKGHLAEAYNALGDHYQENQQFDKAIPLFQKAAKTGKKPYDVAYANISIAACYFEQQRPKDAIPALEATLAVKDGPKDLLAQAQQMLNAARQQAAKQ